MARSLSEIIARFGGELKGDAGRVVSGLATLEKATPDQLTFLANPKYRNQLAGTQAGAVIGRSLGGVAPRAGAWIETHGDASQSVM